MNKKRGQNKEEGGYRGGSSRPGLLPARTRHDVRRGRGRPPQPVGGGCQGLVSGGGFKGRRHQSCPCSALAHFLEGDLLGNTAVYEHHCGYLTLPTRDLFFVMIIFATGNGNLTQRPCQNKHAELFRLS